MRRERRLRANEDFRRVRRDGRSWAHPLLVLVAASGTTPGTRVGVSAGKRVGNAVVRNRAKRLVRESVRLRFERVTPGWDMFFVVRPAAAGAGFREVSAAVEQLLTRAGLLSAEA